MTPRSADSPGATGAHRRPLPARGGERPPAAGRRPAKLAGGATVFLVALLLFAPTVGHDFVWDDLSILLPNPLIGDWSRVGEALTSDFFREREARGAFDYWRPLVVLTHMVERSLFGDHPAGYHAVNVLLHATTSLTVFLLALAALGRRAPALAAGLLFAVHPVHVEVVAWVSGRSDLLLGLFLALALLADWRAGRTGRRRWRVAALAGFLAALFAKESAAVFPALVAARALLTGERRAGLGRQLLEAGRAALPPLLVLVAYLALRYGLLDVVPPEAAGRIGRPTLFWTWWSAFLLYARLLVWPADPSIVHPVPLATGPWSWAVGGGLLLLGAALRSVARLRRASPGAAFGLLMLLIGLAPLSNFLIPIASHGEAGFPVAERFLYAPSIGFCLLAGWLVLGSLPRALAGLARRAADRPWRLAASRSIAPVAAGLLVLAGAWASTRRAADWRDEATLFDATVRSAPGSAMARLNYAAALVELARAEASAERRGALLERARHHFETAATLAPDNYRAWYDLANLEQATGRFEAAESAYRAALRIRPDLFPAMVNLGALLARSERPAEALEWLDRAQRLRPGNLAVLVNRGHVLQELGRPAEAIAVYRRALAADPGLAAARAGLERALESAAMGDQETR